MWVLAVLVLICVPAGLIVYQFVSTKSPDVSTNMANHSGRTSANPKIVSSGLQAMDGVVPRMIPIASNWMTYQNTTDGVVVKYPASWKSAEAPDHSHVDIYPPESDPSQPTPLISMDFLPSTPFDRGLPRSPYTTTPTSITVGGVTGRNYEDDSVAVPTETWYVELPWRSGTLLVTATKGPNVNLVPQAQEILKTMVLQR